MLLAVLFICQIDDKLTPNPRSSKKFLEESVGFDCHRMLKVFRLSFHISGIIYKLGETEDDKLISCK